MSPMTATVLGIPGVVLFWVVTIAAAAIFFRRIRQLVSYMMTGRKEESYHKSVFRFFSTLGIIVGQWCQLKNVTAKNRAGIGHAFMAWGFFTFSTFYFLFIILGEGFGLAERIEHNGFFLGYARLMDVMACLVIIGAAWGIIRRFVIRPSRLSGEQTTEAMIILLSVFFHPITHLFKEATNIALGNPPAGLGGWLPPVSNFLSHLFANSTRLSVEHANIAFFWAHWLTVLFVLVFIAYSRYLHVVASVFNVFFRSPLPVGALRTINLETAESFGASKMTDFTWKQMLDLYACVVCGQCQDRCPAFNSGKPLNPKKVVQDLKNELLVVGPGLVTAQKSQGKKEANPAAPAEPAAEVKPLAGNVVTEDEIWACTTCRSCDEVCPVSVDHIDKIVDMRRNLVMERSQMPVDVQQALQCLATREHPYKGTASTRTDWTKGLDIKLLAEHSDIDILFWVGCTAALDERNQKVAIATAKILKAAGVNFGVLGTQEACCGDPARRMGDEYQFQTLCQKNIETMKSYNINKIITTCPHCFNTLTHEYPQFGGNYEVIHHTQFILDLINSGKITVGGLEGNKTIAYHDSCYLGRYNNIYQQPRKILNSIGGLNRVEMKQNKGNGFCCGGGGGHMWMEEDPDKRVNIKRTEQLIESKANMVATACPYCLAMFEDGLKAKGANETIQAKDLSELVLEAMTVKKL